MAKDQTEQITKLMRILGISEEEAKDVIACDKAIDKGEKMPFDLTAEQEKEVKKLKNCGTRKASPIPQNKPKARKENTTKSGMIKALFAFLTEKSDIPCENVAITNTERMIAFEINGEKYELTLIAKRKPK